MPWVIAAGKLLVENLTGSGTGFGNVTVQNGAILGGHGHIAGNVSVQPGGIFSPGASPGTLSVDSLTLEPDTILAIEIGRTTPGTKYDQVDVTGQLVLDGKLQISLIGGYVPQVGDTFHILQSGSLSGSFAAVESPNLGASMAVVASGIAKGGLLAVIELLLGDFNLDGHVNAADIPAMVAALTDVNQFKTMNGLSDSNLLAIGDIDHSGAVTNADVQALLDTLKSGGGSVDPVPEPASLVLMALALPGLAFGVSRRRDRLIPALPGVVQMSNVRLQLGCIIYSCECETCQESTLGRQAASVSNATLCRHVFGAPEIHLRSKSDTRRSL